MEIDLSFLEIAGRLMLAFVLGSVLGWEREARKKPAGLKTHMLVSIGAASFTLITFQIFQQTAPLVEGRVSADPIRVVDAIISGIGFLGGGAIIQARGSVEGLTTAATIWVTGAIGIACGAGYYKLALTTVLLAIVVLTLLRVIEKLVWKREQAEDKSR